MSNSTNWLKQIEPELLEVLSPRLDPHNFTISLSEIEENLSSALGISPLSIKLGAVEWKIQDHFFSGLGSTPISLSIQLTPIPGDLLWVMSLEDLTKLTSWYKDQNGVPILLESDDLIKGMYRYVSLVILNAFTKIEPFKNFSPKLTEKVKILEKGYTIDVSLGHKDEIIWGRLILSTEFKRGFEDFFASKTLSLRDLPSFQNLPLTLNLINGSIEMTESEWKSLKVGDFIVVDNMHFHPKQEKGSFKLLLENTISLFQIKFKEGKLKILDFLLAYQETRHDS